MKVFCIQLSNGKILKLKKSGKRLIVVKINPKQFMQPRRIIPSLI